jgi:CheY-like chemotaxis protein
MTSFADLKILLVDDNAHMRAILGTLLKSLGVRQITEVRDGGEALQVLHRWPADIAFVDLLMQPMDGLEFTRRLRAAEGSLNPYLPIIMITGHADKVRVSQARDAGITEFLVKPITGKSIIDRMNAVIFRPRDFIRTGGYFGPSRRRIEGQAPVGGERRQARPQARPASNITEI